MPEYVERESLLEDIENTIVFSGRLDRMNPKQVGARMVVQRIKEATAADVAPMCDLKGFAEDVLYQFGYNINYNGRLHLSSGGLSTLERAFSILGWEDPRPFPEGECEWEGCHAYASCGTPTPNGYKRVCCRHYADI